MDSIDAERGSAAPARGPFIGRPLPRFEDLRLVRGSGRYTDDVSVAQQAFAIFVRSPHAHARVSAIDTSAALGRAGVLAVLTGRDYLADGHLGMAHPNQACAVALFTLFVGGTGAGLVAGFYLNAVTRWTLDSFDRVAGVLLGLSGAVVVCHVIVAGLALYCEGPRSEPIVALAGELGYECMRAGRVEEGPRRVILEPLGLTFDGSELELSAR